MSKPILYLKGKNQTEGFLSLFYRNERRLAQLPTFSLCISLTLRIIWRNLITDENITAKICHNTQNVNGFIHYAAKQMNSLKINVNVNCDICNDADFGFVIHKKTLPSTSSTYTWIYMQVLRLCQLSQH